MPRPIRLTSSPADPGATLPPQPWRRGALPALLLALCWMLSLSACGGGGSGSVVAGPPPGTSGSVTLAGTLSGTPTALQFNHQPVHAPATVVTLNGHPGAAAQLRPGVVLFAKGTKDGSGITLQTADLITEMKGPIASLDLVAATLTVLGNLVKVDALTQLEAEQSGHVFSALTLADFALGDVVSVFGTRLAGGEILATRIEREGPEDAGGLELRGVATGLDTTAKTFTLGAYLVAYGSADVIGVLAEGSPVEVEGTLSGTAFTASRVRVEGTFEHGAEGELELSGAISDLDPAASTFFLRGLKVDYGKATLKGSLSAGVAVEVEGALSATDLTTLLATKVEVASSSAGEDASGGRR